MLLGQKTVAAADKLPRNDIICNIIYDVSSPSKGVKIWYITAENTPRSWLLQELVYIDS